jgi:hypothetical protein
MPEVLQGGMWSPERVSLGQPWRHSTLGAAEARAATAAAVGPTAPAAAATAAAAMLQSAS